MEKRKTLAIVPAEGWYARFKMSDGTYEDGRIAVWGYYRDEDEPDDHIAYSVGGLMPTDGGYLEWADEPTNFERLVYLGGETRQWIHPAQLESDA